MRLNHVALTVGDREVSAAFYGQHFELSERVHEDEYLLIVGSRDGSLVALREGVVPDPLPSGNHFGFQAKDADQVRSAREWLSEAGVRETEWQDDHGFVRVQVADPDGYLVEVFAIASGSPLRRPPRSRWTSFIADRDEQKPRVLHEQANPAHGYASSTTGTRCSCTSATRTARVGPSLPSTGRLAVGPLTKPSGNSTPPKRRTRSFTPTHKPAHDRPHHPRRLVSSAATPALRYRKSGLRRVRREYPRGGRKQEVRLADPAASVWRMSLSV